MTFDINDYWDAGYCSVFATALKQRFGGEMWAQADLFRKTTEEFLIHCFCVIDGQAYDCNGATPLQEVIDETSELEPYEWDMKYDPIIQWKQVDENWFEEFHYDYDISLIPEALAYIDNHPELFGHLTPINEASTNPS